MTRNVVDGILCSNFEFEKIDNVKHIICENSNNIKGTVSQKLSAGPMIEVAKVTFAS